MAAIDDARSPLINPILNGPYDIPARHFELAPSGPTGTVLDGRRPSESFVPIAPTRKGTRGIDQTVQVALALTHEQVQRNSLINDLRVELDIWRARGYPGVTPTTRTLLLHWADTERENRVLFAQREAAETAIYLAEVAGREQSGSRRDWRVALEEVNAEHNDALPRIGLKMATGSGKTVVMAMLIAWHTLNKVARPRDSRFVRRFLVVAPGITIRDRLGVLQPHVEGNYYDQRELVPPGHRAQLGKAQVLVINYHQFLLRDSKEIKGVAATTRKLLLQGRVDPFRETPDSMVSRVLRGWGVGSGKRQGEILVLNDEAHHCYQDKPIAVADSGVADPDTDDKARNADARVWFKGLQAISRKVGVKAVYDLSATPFYLRGSGHREGFIFPWVVSDFALMDAIESGIVKIPRTPVDDDAAHDTVTYLDLWSKVGNVLPRRRSKGLDITTWTAPDELVGALRSLYASYAQTFAHWEENLAAAGHTPPVFIVVCPNTVVSKLVHDWIAGYEVTLDDGTSRWAPGNLSLFANVDDGRLLDRPRTVLVDSAQLESGEAMKPEFKQAAAAEISAFQVEMRQRNPGADVEAITDEDLLREVMNTVGKPGRLGEQVRCVVSVAMLTEGWDANTVTHILGLRAFGSQLLCEQVVGRGLRRRSYDVGDDGRFEPEYAAVYGVPFAFIPTDQPVGPVKPPQPSTLVRSVEGREAARITFPKLLGYRLELPERGHLYLPDELPLFVIGPDVIPGWTLAAPVVGETELIADAQRSARAKTVAFHLAARLVRTHYRTDPDATGRDGDARPWLFPELATLCTAWIERAVEVREGFSLAHLSTYVQWQSRAADEVHKLLLRQGDVQPRLRPILHPEPIGSTAGLSFVTRKVALPTDAERCEVSHVVLDGSGGNTWEQLAMAYAEHHRDVAAYVKNDRLGLEIPYVHEGRAHVYVPDFVLRLKQRDGDVVRSLIVEVSGGQKLIGGPRQQQMKIAVARDQWCVAVNNHGGFGRWGYLEITDMTTAQADLDAAIAGLYADGPVVGHTDRADVGRWSRAAS